MLKNCYLIYGEEEWLKAKHLKMIKQQSVGENDLMNDILFEGKESDVSKIIDTCETMPFFATHKLVVVKDGGYLKSGRKDDTQKLVKWLETLPDYVILVFVEKEIDKRNSLYKFINNSYEVLQCDCPEDNQLLKIVGDIAKEKKLQMSGPVLRYFIDHMPRSIHYMIGELEKLAGYCGQMEVTTESIQAVCIFSLEQRVFELLKEVSKKNTIQALEIYNRMIESKESPIGVLVLIARQYRVLMQVKYLTKSRMPIQQIAKEVGLPLFVAKEVEKECHQLTFKQIEVILEACLASDVAIKTGKMEQVKCVELLIIQCIYNMKH